MATPTHRSHSIVAVSGESRREELLTALLNDDSGYDVIHVESIEHAYSRIRQVTPDVVVVFCDAQDVDACQLLSMLNIDPELSGVLVLTCAKQASEPTVAAVPDLFPEATIERVTYSLN